MKTLLLIDANALIHRAFHALPPLTSPDGEPIGAVYGLANTLLKTLKTQKPDYIAAAFDRPEPTFRKEQFADYKAHRPKAADELISQIIKAHELFTKFNIPIFEKPGFEADDIIGTLANRFGKENNLKIVILTGDLDTLQLIGPDIIVRTPQKGVSETIVYDEAAVAKRYGLKPNQLPDYKGLAGDPSDNIPGVPGIGPKTASKLLAEYSDLETLYKKIKPDTPLAKKILDNENQAFLSKRLATIKCDVPLEVDLRALICRDPNHEILVKYFMELGFQSLLQRILRQGELFQDENHKSDPAPLPPNVLIVPDIDSAKERRKELESDTLKIAFDWKPIIKELQKNNCEIREPLFDLKIAGWLLDPGQKDFSLEALTRRFLHKNFDAGACQIHMAELYSLFNQKIKEYELSYIFEKIEMPLIKVLAAMEEWGIGVDIAVLKKLKLEINQEINSLAGKIYKEAGEEFNINSSQQVARIIFEKLNIKTAKTKKTKSGKRSTAENVLLELKNVHPIINLLIDYRENFKIQSAFIEPLLRLTKATGRIHTNFLQTGTATGRLSSEKPNLQNIPQESKWSLALRRAFKASIGVSLVALDYSQLELRLLAHVSGDQKLQKAFRENKDIHQLTAAQVFNVPFEKIEPGMRRIGKTLNFGIVYGMGAKAFSETSGLPLEKAEKFIEEYFNDFPRIKMWQEKVKSEARTFGFVKNLNGRRRWFLNVLTGRPQADYEIERAAVNMPIQSLGADILKLAMIESFRTLQKNGWLGTQAKMLLAIHDELLFEIDDDILKKAIPLLKEVMEKIYELSVPLKVEIKRGKRWGEMENFNNI